VINKAIESFAGQMPDSLPDEIFQENGLLPLTEALRQIHFPDNNDLLTAGAPPAQLR